jgi:hypothetical protein
MKYNYIDGEVELDNNLLLDLCIEAASYVITESIHNKQNNFNYNNIFIKIEDIIYIHYALDNTESNYFYSYGKKYVKNFYDEYYKYFNEIFIDYVKNNKKWNYDMVTEIYKKTKNYSLIKERISKISKIKTLINER